MSNTAYRSEQCHALVPAACYSNSMCSLCFFPTCIPRRSTLSLPSIGSAPDIFFQLLNQPSKPNLWLSIHSNINPATAPADAGCISPIEERKTHPWKYFPHCQFPSLGFLLMIASTALPLFLRVEKGKIKTGSHNTNHHIVKLSRTFQRSLCFFVLRNVEHIMKRKPYHGI